MPAPPRLLPHPDTPAPRVHEIRVSARIHNRGDLELTYLVDYQPDTLRLPAPAPKARVDGLWCHTCCEVFIALLGEAAYREFNFSPAGQWQAYAFDDYRRGGPLEPARGPELKCSVTPGRLALRARLPAADLPALPSAGLWRLGMTAVLEATDGSLSYWALRHPTGQPDFHHPDGFALEIATP